MTVLDDAFGTTVNSVSNSSIENSKTVLDSSFDEDSDTVKKLVTPDLFNSNNNKIINSNDAISKKTLDSVFDNVDSDIIDPFVDTVVNTTEVSSDVPLDQEDLFLYYQKKHPEIFDENNELIDLERADELGITIDLPSDGPIVPTNSVLDVSPHVSTASLNLAYVQPEEASKNIISNENAQMSRLGFAEKNQNDLEKDMRTLISKTTLTSDEIAEALDWSYLGPSALKAMVFGTKNTVTEAIDNRKKQKIIDKKIEDMPDSDMKKFLNLPFVGATGFQTLQSISKYVSYIPNGLGDAIEFMATEVKDIAPEEWADNELPDPKKFADDSVDLLGGILQSLDAQIPLIGQVFALPAKITKPFNDIAKASKNLDIAIEKQKVAKTKIDLQKAGREIAIAKTKFNAAVKRQGYELDIEASYKAGNSKKVKRLQLEKEIDSQDTVLSIIKADLAWNRKMNINKFKNSTEEVRIKRKNDAKKIAEENVSTANELIIAFEAKTGKSVSTKNKEGNFIIDPDKARASGLQTSDELLNVQRGSITDFFSDPTSRRQTLLGVNETKDVVATPAMNLAFQGDEIVSPLLKPDKFNGLVAAVVTLKKAKSDAFKPKRFKPTAEYPKGKEYTVIDHLLDLTIRGDLVGGDEIIDTLNRFGVSFEDYILTVVGSGSEAGRIMQQLSMIKRMRPASEAMLLKQAASIEASDSIRQFIGRVEGIRRGGMVSKLATAARNLQSVGIRAPLESVGNVLDNALWELSNQGILAGVKALNPIGGLPKKFSGSLSEVGAAPLWSQSYRDSFRNLKYIFSPDAAGRTRAFVDTLLENPKLEKTFEQMFTTINEIQKSTGRGRPFKDQVERLINIQRDAAKTSNTDFNYKDAKIKAELEANKLLSGTVGEKTGKTVDTVLSELEDIVQTLNGPNRWQEFLVRRGTFFAELERLVRREYKIDFIDTLENGKLDDLLNDATTVRGTSQRSFIDIMDEASRKAMDVTYAKTPDVEIFKNITNFITRNGLTTVVAFPRFMFNNMELIGQYGGGASIPISKAVMKLASLKKPDALTFKDRQRISRNLVGMAAIGALYQWRTSEEAPVNYRMLPAPIDAPDGRKAELNTQAISPVLPGLWFGEAMKRIENGTFSTWEDRPGTKGFFEVFIGTTMRTGVFSTFVGDIVDLIDGADLTSEETTAKTLGKPVANYMGSWMTQLSQIVDAQRAVGIRGLEFKDAAKDPTGGSLQEGVLAQVTRQMDQLGITTSAEQEEKLPTREYIGQENKLRVGPMQRLLLGLTMTTKDSAEAEYLRKIDLVQWKQGSRSKIPSIRNFENKILREALPAAVQIAMEVENVFRQRYRRAGPAIKNNQSEDAYVNAVLRKTIKNQMEETRSNLSDKSFIAANAPEYIKSLIEFRKLPKEDRKIATNEYIVTTGKIPNISNKKDLISILAINKKLKKLLKFKK